MLAEINRKKIVALEIRMFLRLKSMDFKISLFSFFFSFREAYNRAAREFGIIQTWISSPALLLTDL